MWATRRDFKKKIKQKQKEMYFLVDKKGINDPDVYSVSCEIDNLIVQYMKRYNNCIYRSLFS